MNPGLPSYIETADGSPACDLSPNALAMLTEWTRGVRLLGLVHGIRNPFAPGASRLDLSSPAAAFDYLTSRCPDKQHPLYVELVERKSQAIDVLAALMGTG